MTEKFLDEAEVTHIEEVNVHFPDPEHPGALAMLLVQVPDEVNRVFLARDDDVHVAQQGETEPGGGQMPVLPGEEEMPQQKDKQK